MNLALKLLCVLVLCGTSQEIDGSDLPLIPATPCRSQGCPNITLYLGPKWGTKVVYLSKNITQNENQNETTQVEPESDFTGKPPITSFTPSQTVTNPKNVDISISGNRENDSELNERFPIIVDKVEIQLSDILGKPYPKEGIEEFDLFEPKSTSIYDRDSESEESFDEFLQQRDELRKPVPNDNSFSIDFGQPVEDKDVIRVLPNSPDHFGVLDWSGYQLTGDQVKKALYMLSPSARDKLRHLDVSGNLIRDLEPLTFPPELETQLEQLRLDGNALQYLSSSCRFELSRLQRLRILSLSHTSLRSFPPLLLPSLETLSLRGNMLTEIPDTLPSVPTLTELDLSENWITEVPEPIDLPHLKILRLNNNLIKYIDKDAFRHCHETQQVFLQHNQLTSPPLELFDSPVTFYLKSNPLDIHLASMLDYEGAVTRPYCPSCPGLPSWVYSFTLNSSLLLISLLLLLLAVLTIRSKLTRLPPYTVLDEKSPI